MRSKELGFRIGTGAFALALVLIVCTIGYELVRQSMAAIQKFGISFWRTETWDPVAGQFGALRYIWGPVYGPVAGVAITKRIMLGLAAFISELCPARLRQ